MASACITFVVLVALFFYGINADMTAKSVFDVLSSRMNMEVDFLKSEVRDITKRINKTDSALNDFLKAIQPGRNVGGINIESEKSVDKTSAIDYHKQISIVRKSLYSEKLYLRSQINAFEKTVEYRLTALERECGLTQQQVSDMQTQLDGGWSSWNSWTMCSVTCGVGIQSRDRLCNNPAPSPFGHYCPGHPYEANVCSVTRYTDGGWSSWNSWSTCSVTCGTGIQSRDRLCNNPTPSPFDQYCPGHLYEANTCSITRCADGGWSSWSTWSTCSVTCGGGIQSRDRLCNNPSPSPLGQYCPGQAYEANACRSNRCPEIISAFTATAPHALLLPGNVLTFSTMIINQGGDFNPSKGIFTTTKPGLYFFSVSLVKKRATTRVDLVYCKLYKNNADIILIRVDPTDDDTDKGGAQATNFAIIHLDRGDVVKLRNCLNPSTNMEYWSSFSGFLLNPDV